MRKPLFRSELETNGRNKNVLELDVKKDYLLEQKYYPFKHLYALRRECKEKINSPIPLYVCLIAKSLYKHLIILLFTQPIQFISLIIVVQTQKF